MCDVTITDEIQMKPEISNKIWFILYMHKIIKYNNKLKVLSWHLLLPMTNSCQTTMECSAIGTFAENWTGTFLYWKRILGNMLFLQIVSCCRLLWLTTGFYSQKKRIIRRMISLPVQRYNRLIKILDKPPSSGRVVTTLFQQLKYILSIQTDLDDPWKLRFSLQRTKHMCLKTSRKTLISAKSLNFSTVTFEQ